MGKAVVNYVTQRPYKENPYYNDGTTHGEPPLKRR
jgi:hypothetical protein